jgi:dTDP-4-dehydrorhamnose 3,5-epimerase
MGDLKPTPTPLQGLYEIRNTTIADARGRFSRLFCEQDFASIRSHLHFTQINLSETNLQGTVRGMHYQTPPAAEAKLIRCLRGRVFDVAVDLRRDSPTFLRWHGTELADDQDLAVFIPEGFAHGFQTLTDDVQLLYFHTASWTPATEAGLRHDDPRLAIGWPCSVTMCSQKDHSYSLIDDRFVGVSL